MGSATCGRRKRSISIPAQLPACAVIIISHNYGRFLTESIASVLGQTAPATQIVVVDDSSTDDIREVAAKFPTVSYVRIDARDVNRARETGFNATGSEVVCFLDADDQLAPDYLERGLSCFADLQVAVVYSDWEYFGNRTGRVTFPLPDETHLQWSNFIHAASLVRRSAIETTHAFQNLPDMRRCQHHCDWALWRRVLTGTRVAAKQSSFLRYRQHDANWLANAGKVASYYDRAALWQEPVSIYIPLSGRIGAFADMTHWLSSQTHPHDLCRLILLDTSQDERFHDYLRRWMGQCDYPDVRIVKKSVGAPKLTSQDYRKSEIRTQVVKAMWPIYDGLSRLDTEYILTIEDDVFPPLDVLEHLLRGMDHNIFSVASPYRGRYGGWMAWDATGKLVLDPRRGLQPTLGNGFGCTLMRRSVLESWTIGPYKANPDYDMALYQRLRDEGRWIARINWDCPSIHAGLLPTAQDRNA